MAAAEGAETIGHGRRIVGHGPPGLPFVASVSRSTEGIDMKIAVYGASGFTGGLAVAELGRRGLSPVLVGRDAERLRKAAAGAGLADAEVRVAGLDDPAALGGAFAGCDAVVNAAGPFALWGEPVVRAAIAAGCHYVDTSGEQVWIKRVLDTAGPAAQEAGVTVVPAMADDGGPGDLIAHLTAGRLTNVADVLVVDARRPGAASRGTARSMAAAFGAGPLEYAGGTWRPATGEAGSIAVPGEDEDVALASFALPGVVTVPRHIRAERVRSGIRTEVAELFASLTPDAVDSVPEVLDEEARSSTRWLMLVEAVDDAGRTARGWVTGPDAYGLTAVIAVEGARRLVTDGAPAGALAPAQAFDAAGFLDALAPHGVTWRVDGDQRN
jgi:short subunit dehydrogenase-like uncharacterized protein